MYKKKYAIVQLLMLNDGYLNGALITSYVHKLFLKKTNYVTDLVLMCDSVIYDKYYEILKKFYNKVVKIDLIHFKINENKYVYAKKYSPWIAYSLNKWQCLNLIEYDKILFIDVDILPLKKEFYNLFECQAPCFELSKDTVRHRQNYSNFDNFINHAKQIDKLSSTINGGLVILKPSKSDYNEYINFINLLFRKNGIPYYMQDLMKQLYTIVTDILKKVNILLLKKIIP